MKIIDLKTNYQVNPLGISLEGLTLSWKVEEAKGSWQVWSRVRIGEDEALKKVVYDSGVRKLFSGAFHPQVKFSPGKQYYWQVQVMDDAGELGESPVQTFEGGHPEGEWTGKWIRAPFVPEIHPVFSKTFQAPEMEEARLYICGLGLYEVYVNGQKAGEEFLAPYCTDYRYWIQYQTYDVGALLQAGTNTIEVYLGNGWYKGKFGYLNKGELKDYYGSEFKLLADLWGRGSDGTVFRMGTDESWLALKSPVVVSGIYDGEMYDARMEKDVAQPPVRKCLHAAAAEPPQGQLMPMKGVGVKRHQVLKVKEIITTDIGETVLDFGQEITGWAAFWAEAPVGQRVILQYGEVLQNGRFYRDNLRTARAEFVYVSDGKRHFARPHFTYYGFRYVKVTGMEVNASNVDDFEAWVLYSDIGETGWITTSNEKVNRLFANTKWSQKDNFLDIPTDCPQRDERLGWTGDAQIFSGTACYHMETPAFFRKYLLDMKYEQKEKGGATPYVVPDVLTLARQMNGEPEFDMTEDLWGEAGASAWGDAATIIPWNLYRFYGNQELLKEQYENMKQWADFIIQMDECHCGGKRLWTCGFHFGDWLSLDAEGEDNREGGTDKHLVASAYYLYSTALTARAAAVLGKKAEADYYRQISEEVRQAIRDAYVTGTGELRVNTQTAYVLGIYFGIFETEEIPAAAARLKALLGRNNDHLLTGFVGTGYLCQALSQAGLSEKAYTLLLNEDYPGWLYEVNLGATTVWERWNSLLPDGSISSTGMNSLNHYAYGSVAQWMYEEMCGMKQAPEEAGFKKILFAPKSDERLDFAKAAYDSASGLWRTGWKREGDRMVYTLEVPFDCQAVFVPEDGYRVVRINGKDAVPTRSEMPTRSEIPIRNEAMTENEMLIGNEVLAGDREQIFSCGRYVIEAVKVEEGKEEEKAEGGLEQ